MVQAKEEILIGFVLDMSGSMESIKSATISGFNEYIDTFKKDKELDVDFALTVFNSANIDFRGKKKIDKQEKLTNHNFTPSHVTPLYDAIGITIKEIDDLYTEYDKVLFVIMTDGWENASKEYTSDVVKKLIEDHEKDQGWEFVYLGANQDAYAMGRAMGVPGGNTMTYAATSAGTAGAMTQTTQSSVAYARGQTKAGEIFADPDATSGAAKKKISKST